MKNDFEYIDIKKVFKKLNTSLNGLSSKESINRLKEYGYNELPKEKKKSIRYMEKSVSEVKKVRWILS